MIDVLFFALQRGAENVPQLVQLRDRLCGETD
jgi:hypothetical protein